MLRKTTLLALQTTLLAVAAVAADTGASGGTTRTVTDEEYSRFPRLFHLDDYEECLRPEHGVYCLGVFRLSADGQNPTFDLMQEYSEDAFNFNRTYLHRGYCVSARCPSPPGRLLDPSLHFADCVARWTKQRGFHSRLHKLDYCITHREHVADNWKMETPHRVFLWGLASILMVNVVGTVYDATTAKGKKNKLLMAWSLKNSWHHLMGTFPAGDPRLAALLPIEAGRVIIMLLVILTHSGCIHYMLYLQNPRYIEQMSHLPMMKFLQNGTSVVQYYFLLSSFLLAKNMLREQLLSCRLLLKLLLKRVVRIAPVYLVAVGFAATWWPLARGGGGGPLWATLVTAESAVCRDKFWSLAFFVGNLVKDRDTCLIQSWFIGVDMQLYIIGGVLTASLARVRGWALSALAGLFAAVCALSVLLAHSYRWNPMMLVTGPEAIRSTFSNVDTFHMFYTKPWGSLPACLVGLFMAHLLHRLENNFNAKDHKRLIILCQLCLLLLPMWTGGGGQLWGGVSGAGAALFLALERPVMCLLSAPLLFGALNGNGRMVDKSVGSKPSDNLKAPVPKGFLHRMFCWRFWYPLGRMSLAVLMLHWCVNMIFAAARPGLFNSTTVDMVVDSVATCVFSYLLAVPLTLLVDIPAQQLFKALTS